MTMTRKRVTNYLHIRQLGLGWFPGLPLLPGKSVVSVYFPRVRALWALSLPLEECSPCLQVIGENYKLSLVYLLAVIESTYCFQIPPSY